MENGLFLAKAYLENNLTTIKQLYSCIRENGLKYVSDICVLIETNKILDKVLGIQLDNIKSLESSLPYEPMNPFACRKSCISVLIIVVNMSIFDQTMQKEYLFPQCNMSKLAGKKTTQNILYKDIAQIIAQYECVKKLINTDRNDEAVLALIHVNNVLKYAGLDQFDDTCELACLFNEDLQIDAIYKELFLSPKSIDFFCFSIWNELIGVPCRETFLPQILMNDVESKQCLNKHPELHNLLDRKQKQENCHGRNIYFLEQYKRNSDPSIPHTNRMLAPSLQ